MEKSILIIGERSTGKTKKAKEIASQYKNDEVVFINYRSKKSHKNPFLFSQCTEKTRLVVYDQLLDISQVKAFLNIAIKPLTVNKQSQYPFTIEPKFILVCAIEITDEQLVKLGPSFHPGFDIVKL